MFLKKVLIKYWATYISITLFTIALMFPIYLQTYDNVKDRQINDLRTLLQSRFDALVVEYNDMTRIVSDLKIDRNFVLISSWRISRTASICTTTFSFRSRLSMRFFPMP